jgi:PBP1b-binding outer membrane lipoprotein LpoB
MSLRLLLILAGAVALGACEAEEEEPLEEFGDNVEETGETIQDEADEAEDELDDPS